MQSSLFHKTLPNFIRIPLALFFRKTGISTAIQSSFCKSEVKKLAKLFQPNQTDHSNSKVLIVCANYNHFDYLPSCVDSVLAQTHTNWQLIIVDDCSTDPNALKLLKAQSARDPRIRTIQLEENSGAYIARNTALEAAFPDWSHITFIDPDDEAYPTALEHMLEVLGPHQGTVRPVLERWNTEFTKKKSMYFGHCPSLHSHKAWELAGGFLPVRVSGDAELTHRIHAISQLTSTQLLKAFHPTQRCRILPGSSSHQDLRERKIWLENRTTLHATQSLNELCISPITAPWRNCNP
tara:strand:- start:84 stop:965 length:882 start_codon:yes stop_codon:yes gene_type:complete